MKEFHSCKNNAEVILKNMLWPEANGQVENFMKNIGKVAKTVHISGKNGEKSCTYSCQITEQHHIQVR
jgi:hypothetical protein